MSRPPLPALKLPLLLLLAALLLTIGGIWWSQDLAEQAEQALLHQQNTLKSAQQQLDHSRQQQHLITTHFVAYQTLAASGFIGAEDRLAWIEAAQHANRDTGLYGLDYRLAPRTASPPELAQGLPLGQTVMTLTLPLLVETDLTHFLTALKARAPGVVRVQGCRLSRLNDTFTGIARAPQLSAECELLWFTVSDQPTAKTGGLAP
jgi:type II secretory pathway pseudopilin PulG